MVFEGINHALEPRIWAEEHFGEAAFFDVRRTERAITIAAAMAAQPGASLPQLFGRWYDTKAIRLPTIYPLLAYTAFPASRARANSRTRCIPCQIALGPGWPSLLRTRNPPNRAIRRTIIPSVGE